ncbi:MAG TPA: hypothetical protein VF331_08975 [Polyangiales bacterium]
MGVSKTLAYGVMPDPATCACGNRSTFDNFTRTASHEIFEAITDPQPFSGWTPEIGDACNYYTIFDASNAPIVSTRSGQTYNVQTQWSQARSACVSATPYLYGVVGSNLYRVDTYAGNRLNPAPTVSWARTTAATSIGAGGLLYIVENNSLWSTNPSTGAYALLGTAGAWSGPALITSIANRLYIVENSRLFSVNPTTGAYTQLGGVSWAGATTMTALAGSLYIIQANSLWKVNPSTGAYTVVGPANSWGGSTMMTAFGNTLYIVENADLFSVNPSTGVWTKLGTGNWTGTTAMTASGTHLYIVQRTMLFQVDTAGAWTGVGTDDWTGTVALTPLN